jgi:hypothetical protein
MHPGKRGKIDPERPRILDRLGLTDRSWTTQVKATESDFYWGVALFTVPLRERSPDDEPQCG